MKTLKLAVIALLLAIFFIGGAFALHYYLLGRAYSSRLGDFQRTYSRQLADLIDSPCAPDASHDVHAFLSASAVNDLFASVVDKPIPLGKRASLILSVLRLDAASGTPLLALKGTLAFGSNSRAIEVDGVATIAPLVARDDSFYTRLHIVSLKPTFASGRFRLAVRGFFGDLVKSIGQEQLDKLPEIQLPLSKTFNIPIAGSQMNISIPTRPPNPDKLNGTLHIPDLSLSAALIVDKALFLPNGLHILLSIDGHQIADCDDPRWKTLTSKERTEKLTADEPNSYFARVNHQAVNALILRLLDLPSDRRSVTFQSTALDGHFYYWDKIHRGPFKVMLYREEKKVYLDRANGATARAEVKGLNLVSRADALTGVVLKVGVSGQVQLHWHYDPGPTGGVGGNVGIGVPTQDHDISGEIRISGSQLEGVLDQPQNIPVQIQVGLGDLGSMAFRLNVPLPKDRLFSATIPTGLNEEITFKVGDTEIRKSVSLTNFEIQGSPQGIVVAGILNLGNPQ